MLFVGFREKVTISVYFIVPAIMITKLYAITILATFNNRPLAVGGPPPLPDLENCYDETTNTNSRNLDNVKGQIRIGRTVVKQVWNDPVPLSHLKVVGQIFSSKIFSRLIITCHRCAAKTPNPSKMTMANPPR